MDVCAIQEIQRGKQRSKETSLFMDLEGCTVYAAKLQKVSEIYKQRVWREIETGGKRQEKYRYLRCL